MKNKIILCNDDSIFDSTLLIPNDMVPFFSEKVRKFGGISKLFEFVVHSKHRIFNYGPLTYTGKTSYAPAGLCLKRFNFKPRNQDWERFRIIAQSKRISMTYLFVLLLIFWNDFEIAVGVPVNSQKISLLISQTVGPLFTRIHINRHLI